jgi:hypothetical protein
LPATRYHASVVYDATRKRVVVFGGLTQGSVRNADTYEWNGVAWTKLMIAGPSARYGAAFAHDARTGRSVLFGGADTVALADTWEFDGTTWSQNPSAGGPPAQLDAAMAYDPGREELVLLDATGQAWVYVDRAWTALATATALPARRNARIVYSPQRQRLVVYGGLADTGTATVILDDMWELGELDGERTWQRVDYGAAPPVRSDPGLAAHASLGGLVLQAGTTAAGQRLADTWIFQYRSEK